MYTCDYENFCVRYCETKKSVEDFTVRTREDFFSSEQTRRAREGTIGWSLNVGDEIFLPTLSSQCGNIDTSIIIICI